MSYQLLPLARRIVRSLGIEISDILLAECVEEAVLAECKVTGKPGPCAEPKSDTSTPKVRKISDDPSELQRQIKKKEKEDARQQKKKEKQKKLSRSERQAAAKARAAEIDKEMAEIAAETQAEMEAISAEAEEMSGQTGPTSPIGKGLARVTDLADRAARLATEKKEKLEEWLEAGAQRALGATSNLENVLTAVQELISSIQAKGSFSVGTVKFLLEMATPLLAKGFVAAKNKISKAKAKTESVSESWRKRLREEEEESGEEFVQWLKDFYAMIEELIPGGTEDFPPIQS